MKRLLVILTMVPLIAMAQEMQGPIFMNIMMTPHPEKIGAFEAGLAAHNKKYHANGAGTVSVFWVASGKNSGKYIWSMGPTAWTALDDVSNYDDVHTADWNNNVAANALPEMETNYWKNDLAHSNFSKDFNLKNLSIFMVDIKRFKQMEFNSILDKVYKVFKTKDPDQQWGAYYNELPNMEGKDFVWVDFFDSSSWMGQEDKFPQWYEEVHGAGSFASFLKDVDAATNGDLGELWIFRKDLSGSSGEVAPRGDQ